MEYETFESMLNRLVETRDGNDRERLESLESIIQALLERLRDMRFLS